MRRSADLDMALMVPIEHRALAASAALVGIMLIHGCAADEPGVVNAPLFRISAGVLLDDETIVIAHPTAGIRPGSWRPATGPSFLTSSSCRNTIGIGCSSEWRSDAHRGAFERWAAPRVLFGMQRQVSK